MIPIRLHARLDAASAAALLLLPRALQWPGRLARPLALAGLGVAAYSLATRYREGPGAGIDLDQHRMLDAAQGAACLAAGLRERAPGPRAFLTGYGAFSLAAAFLTQPPGPRGVALPPAAVAEDELGPDLVRLRCGIVNVAFIGPAGAGDRGWFLVDAGIAGSGSAIRAAAQRRFGNARPAAILLTHGHFDHVGALAELARDWDAPIYAHRSERPYLDGTRSYPPPAPEVGGGSMAELSPCSHARRSTWGTGCATCRATAPFPAWTAGNGSTRPATRRGMCPSGRPKAQAWSRATRSAPRARNRCRTPPCKFPICKARPPISPPTGRPRAGRCASLRRCGPNG